MRAALIALLLSACTFDGALHPRQTVADAPVAPIGDAPPAAAVEDTTTPAALPSPTPDPTPSTPASPTPAPPAMTTPAPPDNNAITPPAAAPALPDTQPSTFTIPTEHPILWFSDAQKLARARAWFAARYPSGSFDPRDDPAMLAFGYLMSGNTTWGQAAVSWAMGFQISASELAGTASDNARWFGEDAMLVFDWCYDLLSAAQRQTLIARWTGYMQTLNQKDWGGTGMPESNYFWGYLRDDLEIGVATYHENAGAAALLDEALINRYTNAFVPFAASDDRGGVPLEGSQYGRYLLDYATIPFATVTALGRNLFTETPFFREAVYALIYSTTDQPTALDTTPGQSSYQVFPFADDEFFLYGGSAAQVYQGNFMQEAAVLWQGTDVGQRARAWLDKVQPDRDPWIASLDEATTGKAIDSLPLDYYASGPKFFFARSQWGGTSILTQMGMLDGGHVHQDWGTFQVARKGRWLSRETVGYSDTIAGFTGAGLVGSNHSLAHNSVLFEGNGRPGIGDAYGDGPTKVVRVGSSPNVAYAAVDLSQSYRAHASNYVENGALRDDNPYVKTAVRELIFVRPLDAIVLVDRLESVAYDRPDVSGVTTKVTSAAAVKKSVIVHFETAPVIEANASGNHAVLGTNGDQALRVRTLAPADVTLQVVNEQTNGASIGQQRLEITASGAAQTTFVNVLEAKDAAAASLTATLSEDAGHYTVQLSRAGTGTAVIVVNKGMAVSCAQVGFSATGVPTPGPLVDHVQDMTVTEAGPQWGASGTLCTP
jgi:hypothetical protein